MSKYKDWLQVEMTFPEEVVRCQRHLEISEDSAGPSSGRPPKTFDDSSPVGKHRKTEEIRREKPQGNYHLPLP